MKHALLHWVHRLLTDLGIRAEATDLLDRVVTVLIILLISLVAGLLFRYLVLGVVRRIVTHTKNTWDDRLFNAHLLHKIAHAIPVIFLYVLLPLAFPDNDRVVVVLRRLCIVYIIIVVMIFLNVFLKVLFDILRHRDAFRNQPVQGLLQTSQIVLYFVGTIVIISVLADTSPFRMLAGLGASAAILMLVFRDSILGFVSGIQLSANDMLQPGDWITMPKYNVDGTVIEVTLNTVKIQNFDNTITTLPPYILISDSFQNWRGMEESGGRRVMRSVNIDITSVRFCTPEMLERYKRIALLKDYLEKKEAELKQYNETYGIDEGVSVNLKRLTNLGILMAYLGLYLQNLREVNHELLCMVRQLQPTENGIPVQLYFFSAIKEWKAYEGVQSDVFNHVMAVIPEFDLYVFQNPSGIDLNRLGSRKTEGGVPAALPSPPPSETPVLPPQNAGQALSPSSGPSPKETRENKSASAPEGEAPKPSSGTVPAQASSTDRK